MEEIAFPAVPWIVYLAAAICFGAAFVMDLEEEDSKLMSFINLTVKSVILGSQIVLVTWLVKTAWVNF